MRKLEFFTSPLVGGRPERAGEGGVSVMSVVSVHLRGSFYKNPLKPRHCEALLGVAAIHRLIKMNHHAHGVGS
jgi:hypothetical protein